MWVGEAETVPEPLATNTIGKNLTRQEHLLEEQGICAPLWAPQPLGSALER